MGGRCEVLKIKRPVENRKRKRKDFQHTNESDLKSDVTCIEMGVYNKVNAALAV